MDSKSKPVIGILGGVGAGKSTVAAELAALGCAVIDADRIGHELLAEPAVRDELVEAFGSGILASAAPCTAGETPATRAAPAARTGQTPVPPIDRHALGRTAFATPDATARLNAIMHPRIRVRLEQAVARARAEQAVRAVVVDAALLLETDWHGFVTHFVFVSAPPEQRRARVAQARGWDGARWQQREFSQKPLDIKRAIADYVIDNCSSLSCLREQVRSVFHRIVGQASSPLDMDKPPGRR